MSDIVRRGGVVAEAVLETVTEYADRWLDDREERVHSIRDDRGRMRLHILPLLGALDVHTFDRNDVEKLRDDLDGKIVKGSSHGKRLAPAGRSSPRCARTW